MLKKVLSAGGERSNSLWDWRFSANAVSLQPELCLPPSHKPEGLLCSLPCLGRECGAGEFIRGIAQSLRSQGLCLIFADHTAHGGSCFILLLILALPEVYKAQPPACLHSHQRNASTIQSMSLACGQSLLQISLL